jgi:carboxymethylenebutenolidase
MSRTTITIETRDGRCETSVFRPDASAGPWPAVLVFMDGVGIRPALFEIGERIASHGYYVILPDLFYRAGSYTADYAIFLDDERRQAWFSKYLSTASHANVLSDTHALLNFLAEQPDVKQPKVGTTGYCMGGALSLLAASHYPDQVAAAASYHGGRLATDAPTSPHLFASRIKARVYVAGAIEDPMFPDEQKQRLEEALSQAGVDHVVETYPGAHHGWVPTDSPVYNPEAAERHWQTLIALLDATLKDQA